MLMLVIARALCGIGIGAFDSLMKIVIAGKDTNWIQDYVY